MYARVSTIRMPPDEVQASVDHFGGEILPQARELAGFEGATLLVNRAKGMTKLLTYWTGREELDGSAESATRLRTTMIDRAEGGELVSVEIYEVALDVTGREG